MGLTAIVKPTHDCNLACRYCYVDPSAEKGRMDQSTLNKVMEQVANNSQDKRAHFIWHGGEPLLMGLDFYKQVSEISCNLRKGGYRISNGIQSNATLINDELLDFIESKEDFQLGLSLDGPKHINDRTRIYSDGTSAFEDIFRGVKRTRERQMRNGRKRHIGGGVIVVLSQANINDLNEIYEFFKKERISIKINPLIQSGRATIDLQLHPIQYATALSNLFDKWVTDYKSIDIDPFTNIMGNLMTSCPVGCNFSDNCRRDFISIGPQGDIYPCGRFDGLKEFWMGNINSTGLEPALSSEVHKKLLERKVDSIPGCKPCKFNKICNSGCMHNAYTSGDIMGKDPYCLSYKKIFRHLESFLHTELRGAEVK